MAETTPSIEQRLRAIEDRFAIYNLIASHPPSADTAAQAHIRAIFADDGVLDLGGAKTATGNGPISEHVAAHRAPAGDRRRARTFRRPAACPARRRPGGCDLLFADPDAGSCGGCRSRCRRTACRADIGCTGSAPIAGNWSARRRAGRSGAGPSGRSMVQPPRSISCARRCRRPAGLNAGSNRNRQVGGDQGPNPVAACRAPLWGLIVSTGQLA